MEQVRSLRELFTALSNTSGEPGSSAIDPQAVLRSGGHDQLPGDLVAEAIVNFADAAPLEVAQHLAPFVTAHSAVPGIADPTAWGEQGELPDVGHAFTLLAGTPWDSTPGDGGPDAGLATATGHDPAHLTPHGQDQATDHPGTDPGPDHPGPDHPGPDLFGHDPQDLDFGHGQGTPYGHQGVPGESVPIGSVPGESVPGGSVHDGSVPPDPMHPDAEPLGSSWLPEEHLVDHQFDDLHQHWAPEHQHWAPEHQHWAPEPDPVFGHESHGVPPLPLDDDPGDGDPFDHGPAI